MLLFLLLLAAAPDWVPARWHSADPKSLELLSGTPINCILLDRAEWQSALIRSAKEQGIATLAVIRPADDLSAATAQTAALRMNGIVLEGDFPDNTAADIRASLHLPVIELPGRHHLRLDGASPITGTSEALWPGIEIEHGGSTLTGPTSSPWIDTNSGFLSFFRAATDAALWVAVDPPAGKIYPTDRYLEAVGDAAIAGAHWIVSLDSDLERRLLAREPGALRTWQRIAAYLKYFEEHKEWRGYQPYSKLAVVEDTDNGGLLSAGFLDMISFQHTPVRVIPRRRLTQERLDGVGIVLNLDAAAENPQEESVIEKFTAAGGKLVAPPSGWKFPPLSDAQITPTRHQLEQMEPAWEVAYRATVRKNFGVRLFNVASTVGALLADKDANSLLVHLLNFTDFAGESITLHALGPWKRARLYSPEAPVKELEVYSIPEGTGVDVERIPVFATVRLDR
jgi:hypothetical protein